MTDSGKEADQPAQAWESASHRFTADFRADPARREQLRPGLMDILHESFTDHPDYHAEHLPSFLGADIHLRAHAGNRLAGVFTADLLRVAGEPVAHLSVALVAAGRRSGGELMRLSMGLSLDLASQAFGSDRFYVCLRTANPRVVARLWRDPWVRYYPRRDRAESDPTVAALRAALCDEVFAADRHDAGGLVFHDLYPAPPWGGEIPWHHDQAANRFCREHLRPEGRDAFSFLGPTQPPFKDLPRGKFEWRLGRV